MRAAILAALAAAILVGETPEAACTDNNPKTIEAHCDLRVRLDCDGNNMCTPRFYWVAKSRQGA